MDKTDYLWYSTAQYQALSSPDPNKKVGCVVVDPVGKVLSTGYNCFPKGIEDTKERWDNRAYKNLIVVHAEVNALLSCNRCGGATLYCTSFLCCTCAGVAIQRGIKRVVVPRIDPQSSWYGNFLEARSLLHEAGITINYIDTDTSKLL